MKPFTLVMAIVCLSFSLFALSACAGNANPQWEYNQDVVTYDAECAAAALEPFKAEKQVQSLLTAGGKFDRVGLALIWQFDSYLWSMPRDAMDRIMDSYTQCGASVYATYTTKMGRDRWEMVGSKPLEYTSPASSTGLSAATVKYGYEVQWKRKATK